MARRLSHVIGFDDAPFERSHRGHVLVVGAVFAGARLEGVLATKVWRDGVNATQALGAAIRASRHRTHLQAVLLQGITLGGFNVVDIHALHRQLDLPVLTVTRRSPSLEAIRRALLEHVPGGARKWRLIEAAGAMEKMAGVYVQRAGIAPAEAARLVASLQIHGKLPEPLRVAHMMAGGLAQGESRHRP